MANALQAQATKNNFEMLDTHKTDVHWKGLVNKNVKDYDKQESNRARAKVEDH